MEKAILKSALLAIASVGLMAGNVMATPFNPATDAAAGQLDNLQTTLTSFGSSIDVYNDETGSETYVLTSPVASAWQIHYDYTGSSDLSFGLYNTNADMAALGDSDILTLFNGSTGVPTGDISIVFDVFGTMMLSVGSTSFDTAAYMSSFVFFITDGTDYLFSESDANPSGLDYFLTYQGFAGDSVGMPIGAIYPDDSQHWYVATEGFGSDFDFDELIIRTESMQPVPPVPEPATILLFGTGLMALAGFRRKKSPNAQASSLEFHSFSLTHCDVTSQWVFVVQVTADIPV